MASNESNSNDNPKEMEDRRKWYRDAADYWKEIPATLNGMLGGYAHISRADVIGSKTFLTSLLELSDKGSRSPLSNKPSKKMRIEASSITSSPLTEKVKPHVALDCGAGIGRVTKNLLLPLFGVVDMVEQNPGFLEKAREYLEEKNNRIGHFYAKGLQDFTPQAGRYSVIWCQWVLGHLTDEDFVAFLQRCQLGLVPGGLICVKENITRGGVDVDSNDSSVTRSDEKLKDLFAEASLVVVKDQIQKNFPGELYRVKMYALRPRL